ncbi:hypothetical protein [Sporichthya sp.]|uniref:hypothetical protein n=1 Tax=Sporichthya sp. TaxID=65475 RepID=UPI00180A9FED|nr:hypothetical protein [Sporichthya sp.]MBA3742618.1 hypothetical protein [Sporichthya sp.]
MSVLALPFTALRTGRKLAGHLTLPALAGAAALIYRTVRRSTTGPASASTTGPVAVPSTPTAARTSAPRKSAAPAERELVVDPIPLAEAAVDLDVEVTLPSELPIRSYDALAAKDAAHAIRELTEAEEVRTVLAFEEENSKRSTVLTAARAHLAGLAVQS